MPDYSYYSKVIVGVPSSTFYKIIRGQSSYVTKYDQDTGKPYQVEIPSYKRYWLGKEVGETLDEILSYSWTGEKIPLESHIRGYGGCEYFGIEVSTICGSDSVEISFDRCKEAWKRVVGVLTEFGINEQPKVFQYTESCL